MGQTTNVYIADDHKIMRDGLNKIITEVKNYYVIGETGDGRAALENIEKIKPDIAILDILMPTMTGITVARQLKKYNPQIKILILTEDDNEDYVEEVFSFGVEGYLLKENGSSELLLAMRSILDGHQFLAPKMQSKIFHNLKNRKNNNNLELGKPQTVLSLLTPREQEVLKMVAEGTTNKGIGKILLISPDTVKVHRAKIMKKINAHKVSELVLFAVKSGIVAA